MDKQTAEQKYNELIDFAKSRKCIDGRIYEKHHIKPKSLFPELSRSPENIAKLTCSEHILAHYYLCFIYPEDKLRFTLKKMTRGKIDAHDEDAEFLLEMFLDNMAETREKFIIENYGASPHKPKEKKKTPEHKEPLRKRMSISKMDKKKKIKIKNLAQHSNAK